MKLPAIAPMTIKPMTPETIDKVAQIEAMMMLMPQVDIKTIHTLHAGLYGRTVFLPAGTMITGVLIKIPTVLIVAGKVVVYVGEESRILEGYSILEASAMRKQVFIAEQDTWLTMLFASNAKTVEDAEAEFTDEVSLLITRKKLDDNNMFIAEN